MLILIFDTEDEKRRFMYIYEIYGKNIWNTIHQLIEDKQEARNYVITLSNNYCLNYLEQQERNRMDFCEDMSEFNSPVLEPLNWVLEKDAYQRLLEEIGKLGDTYKEAM